MYPYFDPKSYSLNNALNDLISRHIDRKYIFTFILLIVQIAIAYYLLVFEAKNLIRYKSIFSIQFLALIYNIELCLLPIMDIILFCIEYL